MAVLCRLKPFATSPRRLAAAAAPLLLRRLQPYYYTSVAEAAAPAAAQPVLDYCEEDNECDSVRSLDRVNKADSDTSVPQRGVQWVFIGFKNKHFYAERVSKLLEVPHISISSLLRQDLSPRSALYKQIATAVNQGTLVPEDIIFGLLSKRLEDGHYLGETGFILDGIPRTYMQAKILDKLVDIDLVVNFKCTEDYIVGNYGNSSFAHCHDSVDVDNLTSQSKMSPSKEECLWKEKVLLYMKQIKPLEDYYKKQKKIVDVQVTSAPGETWQGLLSALHLRKSLHKDCQLRVRKLRNYYLLLGEEVFGDPNGSLLKP